MIVVYDSLTGQGVKMAQKIGLPFIDIREYKGGDEKIILLTRSYNFGEITDVAKEFLDKFADKVIGVTVSGNKNWGLTYGAAGDKINAQYGIELISKFEGTGFPHDVEIIQNWIKNYNEKKESIQWVVLLKNQM